MLATLAFNELNIATTSIKVDMQLQIIWKPFFNHFLTSSVHWKVIHTQTNRQLSATDLFKVEWPFSGQETLAKKV